MRVLNKLAAQHNQQRTSRSIADARYEIPLAEIRCADQRSATRRGSAWLLVGDDSDAIRPFVDALTARGHRHRIVGLPVSDADEESSQSQLRAAAADDPTLRIVHVAALDTDPDRDRVHDAVAVADATPNPRRNTAALPRRGRGRTAQTDLAGDPRRTAGHRRGHRVARAELPVGVRSRRRAGASAGVGRTGRSGEGHGRRVVRG